MTELSNSAIWDNLQKKISEFTFCFKKIVKIKGLRQLCLRKMMIFLRKKNRENVAVSRLIAFNTFDLTRNYELFCGKKYVKML